MPLLTYDDLAANAVSDPTKRVADLCLERMQSMSMPMPPGAGPTVPAAERDAFRAWVEAGLPRGECGDGGDGGGDVPAPIETVCTSGLFWERGRDNPGPGGDELDKEGPWMNPGLACIQCHLQEEEEKGQFVLLGGTVYPTLREPDLCYGVDGSAVDADVVVVDARGTTFTLRVEETGNFALRASQGPVTFPITAKVVANGKERVMSTPQSSGDCNGCHTEQGNNGAPGRIFLP